MNELQKIEFDMLKEVVRVCSELKLTYYLVCGSALGSIKYRGFIPWDDDMDIALPRRDYEIFIKEAQALLPENLFLQNYHTEPSFPQIFSKLRNSEAARQSRCIYRHLPFGRVSLGQSGAKKTRKEKNKTVPEIERRILLKKDRSRRAFRVFRQTLSLRPQDTRKRGKT